MAKFSSRVVRSLVAGILITIGGCSEPNPTISPDAGTPRFVEIQSTVQGVAGLLGGEQRAEKVIGPEGGTLAMAGGHTLTFPAGALSRPTKIKAKSSTRFVEVDLGPEGLTFPTGHEPVLTLNYAGTNSGLFSTLSIVYLSDSGEILEVLRTENDSSSKTVKAQLRHFSRYATIGH